MGTRTQQCPSCFGRGYKPEGRKGGGPGFYARHCARCQGSGSIPEFTYTTQAQVRAAFWEEHSSFDHQVRAAGIRSKGQNAQCATVRCTFVDWINSLSKDGQISEALAQRVTL
jgi:hypothetical protein